MNKEEFEAEIMGIVRDCSYDGCYLDVAEGLAGELYDKLFNKDVCPKCGTDTNLLPFTEDPAKDWYCANCDMEIKADI